MKLILPVEGFPVTLPFGAVYGADIQGKGWNYAGQRHNGVDFGCPAGTTVRASAAGKVVFCGWDSTGYGNLIRIRHADGSETRYAHLESFITVLDAVVSLGQPIAASGATGNVTGAHLHWEYRREDKRAVDPLEYVRWSAEEIAQEEAANGISIPDTGNGSSNYGNRGFDNDTIPSIPGYLKIVSSVAPNARRTPGGDVLFQAQAGAEVLATGRTQTAAGLHWRELLFPIWIAERDWDGTRILERKQA